MLKAFFESAYLWLKGWWHVVYFAAIVWVAALSPSSYSLRKKLATPSQKNEPLLNYLYTCTVPVLPWFTVLMSLVSLVLIRIVVVTAQSYGLSQYALEVVVRVLVMELLPLSAALFVAFRTMVPMSVQLLELKQKGHLNGWEVGASPLSTELVPRMLAGVFAVLTLVVVSGSMALVLAYLVVNGFSVWGLSAYTRTVGQVFLPAVVIGFALKTFLFAIATATIPMASSLQEDAKIPGYGAPPPGIVRLLTAILMIETATLVLKYF